MGAGLAIATGVAGLATSAFQFFDQKKRQKRAERAIKEFKFEERENPYEMLRVSTLGADLRREEAARATSTLVDTLRQGGTRAVLGGIGGLQAQNNLINQQIAANLDEQQRNIDVLAAQREAQIQDVEMRREDTALQGLGQQLDVAQANKYQALTSGVNALGALSQVGRPPAATRPQVQTVSTLPQPRINFLGGLPAYGQGFPVQMVNTLPQPQINPIQFTL